MDTRIKRSYVGRRLLNRRKLPPLSTLPPPIARARSSAQQSSGTYTRDVETRMAICPLAPRPDVCRHRSVPASFISEWNRLRLNQTTTNKRRRLLISTIRTGAVHSGPRTIFPTARKNNTTESIVTFGGVRALRTTGPLCLVCLSQRDGDPIPTCDGSMIAGQ